MWLVLLLLFIYFIIIFDSANSYRYIYIYYIDEFSSGTGIKNPAEMGDGLSMLSASCAQKYLATLPGVSRSHVSWCRSRCAESGGNVAAKGCSSLVHARGKYPSLFRPTLAVVGHSELRAQYTFITQRSWNTRSLKHSILGAQRWHYPAFWKLLSVRRNLYDALISHWELLQPLLLGVHV